MKSLFNIKSTLCLGLFPCRRLLWPLLEMDARRPLLHLNKPILWVEGAGAIEANILHGQKHQKEIER